MPASDICEFPAIDVHGHYGHYFPRSDEHPAFEKYMTGSADEVVRRATQVRTAATVVSPLSALLPRGGADVVQGNEEAMRIVPATPGLLQWVVIDPRTPATFDQARRMLAEPHCVGIKIHPEEHIYPIRDFGDRLFEFASSCKAVVLAHSGDPNSLPADFVPFADAYPDVRLILAHIGHGVNGDPNLQLKAMLASRHGNIFADTSSAKSIVPLLIEHVVSEVGANRVLYGTDAPLYCNSMQRARIDYADLTDNQKRRILLENAAELFKPQAMNLIQQK